MPEFWNNIIVVTVEELVPNWWPSYEALKKQVARYSNKTYGLKRVQRGCNNRKMLIDFDSLPKEIQIALGDPRKVKNILENYYETDAKAVAYYSNYKRPNFGYLKQHEQDRYIVNASVLKAVLQLEQDRTRERLTKGGSLRASRNGAIKSVSETILEDTILFNKVLKLKYNEEHNLPAHPRRFALTLKGFKNDGYYHLIKDPEGKSFGNAKKVSNQTLTLLNNLFATQKHKPTATEVHRQYQAFLSGYLEVINNNNGEEYNPKQFKSISDSTVKAYLSQWKNAIANHAIRSGNRQIFTQKYKPYHSMKKPNFAGSLLSIDDRQPPFWYEKRKRVWFYNGIDVASEAWVTWVHGKTKEGIIIDFYRQLVRNYHEWGLNLPYELECESSLNSSFKDTFLREGAMFQKVRIEANNARGKIVERKFGQLRYNFEKELDGWLARPHSKSESNQKGSQKEITQPYSTIVENSIDQMIKWNNMAHPDQTKHPNKSRWEVFIENQHPDLKPTNYIAILPYIGYKTVSSCNAGITKLQNEEYLIGNNGEIALGDDLPLLMSCIEGKSFSIYWLDDNFGEVFKALVFIDNRYICELIRKPIYQRATLEQSTQDMEARRIMSAYNASIESYLRKQKNSLDKVTVINNSDRTLNNKFSAPGSTQLKKRNNTYEIEELREQIDNTTYNPFNTSGPSWKDSFLNS